MYQAVKPKILQTEACVVRRIADNAFIPFDPQNRDYAEYLKWLSEGNQPLPADEEQK